ncbi:MAG: hypothetical protein HYX92_18770 [Chloroflexi bacterium]|nr:hypothetical protein [Chloroflexota bacterium]
MRILAIMQGQYGRRIVDNIGKRAPANWAVASIQVAHHLPAIIDDPDEFLTGDVPQADLVLGLGESVGAAQLLPEVVKRSGARAAVAAIDNTAWLPTGLKNQIKNELAGMGVASAFPKTFCTLTETTCGFRRFSEPYNDETIAAFARLFGRPRMRITVDPTNRTLTKVEVVRGAPCGSTQYTAERLVGLTADEAAVKSGLICHHYPCLASMAKEQIDTALFDTLMHISGYVMQEEVEKEVRPFMEPARYFTPGERVETREPGGN